jgi:hypothetical protein
VKFGIEFAILGCLYVLVDRVIGYVAWLRRPKAAATAPAVVTTPVVAPVAAQAAPASPAT